MSNTGQLVPGGAQGAPVNTLEQQRNAANIQKILETVDTYFRNHGLTEPIDTLNTLVNSLVGTSEAAAMEAKGQEVDPQIWSDSFIREAHFDVGEMTILLARLYELNSRLIRQSQTCNS